MSSRGAEALPLLLTWARIGLIPFFGVAFYLPIPWHRELAALLFVLAGVTDWLDGHLARRLDQTSSFGALLDPLADKLMVAVALVVVLESVAREFGLPWSVPVAVAAAVILVRELAVSALRQWVAGSAVAPSVAVSLLGKVKTAMQIVALTLLLLARAPGGVLWWLGTASLLASAALACLSLAGYLTAAAQGARGAPPARRHDP